LKKYKHKRAGVLMRIRPHCRNNALTLQNGEYAILANPEENGYANWEALYPTGLRVFFYEPNWEIFSE